MKTVLVLGATGMLGSEVARVLSEDLELGVYVTSRSQRLFPRATSYIFNAKERKIALPKCDWVVNCIGVIKPRILENSLESIQNAVEVNSLFPYRLASWAEENGAKVIQIATDCVFSGRKARLDEEAIHDAFDIYGRTKSLGEVRRPVVRNIRCSIIGRQHSWTELSLMEWLLRQPQGATVNGYIDHMWNGVTTTAFARVCKGVVKGNVPCFNQHLVPEYAVSKFKLLNMIAGKYRPDLTVNPVRAGVEIYRALSTLDAGVNELLWECAGYKSIPAVSDLIDELPVPETFA